jgi:antitoxin component YwqK of YwqJK toxin-antitoxin module
MPKFLAVLLITHFYFSATKAQKHDTVVVFFKYNQQTLSNSPGGFADYAEKKQVSTIDSADYIRELLPPDSGSTLNNIREFYKNGHLKFIGKFDLKKTIDYRSQNILLSGYCVAYYPNGKKRIISNFVDGKKDGLEYLYRPDSKIYCTKKNVIRPSPYFSKVLYWDCYDAEGNMTCKEGNGYWTTYDEKDFKTIILQGEVKNGFREGEWKGIATHSKGIRYTYLYRKGDLISAFGYDSTGTAYPFHYIKTAANYERGIINFVESVTNQMRSLRGPDGTKMNLDTVHLSVIVEKNGTLSDVKTLGNMPLYFMDALRTAIKKTKQWEPSRYFGVPYRTNIIFSLKYQHGYNDYGAYVKAIRLKEYVLDYGAPELSADPLRDESVLF